MSHKDPGKNREAQARYRERHREEIRERSRVWQANNRLEHPEECRGKSRQIRLNNIEHYRLFESEWAKNNPEKVREKSKKYYDSHPEKCRDKSKIWRINNPGKRKEQKKRYALKHKGHIKIKSHGYYESNKDFIKTRVRIYAQENTEKSNEHSKRRRALKMGASINDFNGEQWKIIKLAYNSCCIYCGKKFERLTQDHVIPLTQGGNHTASNVVPACRPCNSSKHTGPPLPMHYKFSVNTECP